LLQFSWLSFLSRELWILRYDLRGVVRGVPRGILFAKEFETGIDFRLTGSRNEGEPFRKVSAA
jgi:hypothetical protein